MICGTHAPDWMEALRPDAPVWKQLSNLRKLLVEHRAEAKLSDLGSAPGAIVIPLMEDHIAACLHQSPRAYSGLLPSAEALATLRDKARFAAYVETQSLTRLCPEIYRTPESTKFPCVLKRTDLNGGAGIDIATSPLQLQELLTQDLWRDRPVILQQLIPGNAEYVAHCVCKRGKILWHCVYEYALDPSSLIRRGINATRRAAIGRKQIRQIQSFLRPLKYTGPCNIDFKILDSGDIVVFEINPRLGGSLMRPRNVADLQATLGCIIENAR